MEDNGGGHLASPAEHVEGNPLPPPLELSKDKGFDPWAWLVEHNVIDPLPENPKAFTVTSYFAEFAFGESLGHAEGDKVDYEELLGKYSAAFLELPTDKKKLVADSFSNLVQAFLEAEGLAERGRPGVG